VLFCNDTA